MVQEYNKITENDIFIVLTKNNLYRSKMAGIFLKSAAKLEKITDQNRNKYCQN
jgi:hypothetical protein